MTPAISAQATLRSPLEAIQRFRENVIDWSDAYAVASSAASALRAELVHPSVFVYRYDSVSCELVLLARVRGQARHAEAVGTRSRPGDGPLGRAVREATIQKSINSYVEPDFVRSLPGETRSEVAVPVMGDEGVRGVVHLVYGGTTRPHEIDVELATLMAAQIETVMEAAAAGGEEAAGVDGNEVAALAVRLARCLANHDDIPAAMQIVVEGAMRLSGAGGALLLVRHGSRQALEVAASAGEVPEFKDGLIPMDGTIPGEVARGGRSRIWRRADDPQSRFGAGDSEEEIHDALVVPLSAVGKTFGALAVMNRVGSGTYTPTEIERLQLLAHHAAPIEPMRRIEPLRRRLSDNSLIAEVGRAVTGTLGLDEVLGLVVRAAEMLIGARGVALALITEGGDRLQLVATSGALRGSQGQTLPIQGTLIGWCVATSTQVVSPCVSDDSRGFISETRQGPGVVVPLESRARIWGALLVTRADGAPAPSDEDIDALSKLASYASIAIDNAQLYREQTDLSQALRAQADELTRAYAELRESQERLVVAEKMAALGRITAGIAHEINSPLGGILNCLQLAHSYAGEYQSSIGDPDVTAEDHQGIANDLLEAVVMAESATRKVAQFVRAIKGQTRTGEDLADEPFEIAEEVEAVLTLLSHDLRSREVQVLTQVEADLTLVGDRSKFSLVLQNLLNNAIDSYEDRPGDVWVRARKEGECLVLEVTDQGCGIPEAIRSRIFDYLFTTKDVGKGTGLGLSIVHSIVASSFHGEIDVESQPGKGTTFLVRFPISRPLD